MADPWLADLTLEWETTFTVPEYRPHDCVVSLRVSKMKIGITPYDTVVVDLRRIGRPKAL